MIKFIKKFFEKKCSVTLLNEKWEILKLCDRVDFIPRTNEIVYLPEYEKYYRVANVVYNFEKTQGIFVVIEEYTDDFALNNEKEKKKKDGKN